MLGAERERGAHPGEGRPPGHHNKHIQPKCQVNQVQNVLLLKRHSNIERQAFKETIIFRFRARNFKKAYDHR